MSQSEFRTRIDEGLLGLHSMRKSVYELDICVDPRMELLSVIQWLSEYGNKYPLLSRQEFSYKQEVNAHFTRYQEHEAVHFLNDLISRPFSYENPPFSFGAPPEVFLYLHSNGKLREDIFDNDFLVGRAGGRESLEQFVIHALDFFHDSGFEGFYTEHLPYYQYLVHGTAKKIGKRNYIMELEQFYGTQHGSYTLILVPLYHSVGYGPRITVGGTHHIYNIMGPRGIEVDMPEFGSESYFAGIQRHEFSHGFVNPLTEQFWDQAAPYFTAYNSLIEAQEIVNESIVRAVATLLAYVEGDTLGEQALQQEKGRGFDLVEPLVVQMKIYVQNREIYPTFGAFYPKLLEVFKGHAHTRYTEKSRAETVEEPS